MKYQFAVTVEFQSGPRTFKIASHGDAMIVFNYAKERGLAVHMTSVHVDTISTSLEIINDEIATERENKLAAV